MFSGTIPNRGRGSWWCVSSFRVIAYRLLLGKTIAIAGDSLCLKVDNNKQLEKNGDDALHPFDK